MQEPVTASAVDDIEVEQNGQATVRETAAAPPEVSVAATEEADDTAESADETLELKAEEAPKAKPRNSIQAKIDQAVGRQREAERRAEAAERELTALRQPRQPEPEKREPQYTRPKPVEDEVGTKYKTYPEFIEDLQDWKLEQRDVTQAQQLEQQRVESREQQRAHHYHEQKLAFGDRISKHESENPSFVWKKMDPRVLDLNPSDEFTPSEIAKARTAAMAGNKSAAAFLSRLELSDAVFDSDYSPELIHHFTNNFEQFQRLSTLPPRQIVREIGRLEAKFVRTEAAVTGPAPKTPVISHAPPPIKPVGTTASAVDRNPLEEDMDVDEHIRVMNARDKRGRFK